MRGPSARAKASVSPNGTLTIEHADVPDLVGIAIMTDGDQTSSESAAEWMRFELQY